MSLQWGLVAGLLYSEGAFLCLLLIPFISPKIWRKLFKSRLVSKLHKHGIYIFISIVAGLTILLLDAARVMYKSDRKQPTAQNGIPTMETIAEFRAQRNFYITGTALFLLFVIKRLIALILRAADFMDEIRASHNELNAAKKEVRRLADWKEHKLEKELQEADNEGSSDEIKKDE